MNFPTTQWSLLAQSSWDGGTQSRRALEALCGRYWGPIHQFIRSDYVDDPEAQDLTQDFMLHLLQKSLFDRADPLRGRFRSFLLGALVRFLRDAVDRKRTLKRGGALLHLSLESGELGEDEQIACAPDAARVFDREWAVTILECSLERVRAEYVEDDRGAVFAALQQFLPGNTEPPTYDEAASQLGLSLGALKSEVHRLRRRLRAVVREEVAQTVSAPHEMEAEMAHLQEVLMDRTHVWSEVMKPAGADS
jgi:RNA polymerase sigma factor (sigma-70 family)